MKKDVGLMINFDMADEIPASCVTDDELQGAIHTTWANRWKRA